MEQHIDIPTIVIFFNQVLFKVKLVALYLNAIEDIIRFFNYMYCLYVNSIFHYFIV